MEQCRHNWRIILKKQIDYDILQRVVWCETCGAIRCDGIHDGKVFEGKYVDTTLPERIRRN